MKIVLKQRLRGRYTGFIHTARQIYDLNDHKRRAFFSCERYGREDQEVND